MIASLSLPTILLAAAWRESAPQYGQELGRRLGRVRPCGTSERHRPASVSLRRNVKRNEKCTEYLRYQFTPEETATNAQDLARKTQAIAELELMKKQLAADLKAKMDAALAEVAKLARWVNDGHDFRSLPCIVKFNDPRNGRKTIFREDTGEVVRTDDMDASESQEELPLQ